MILCYELLAGTIFNLHVLNFVMDMTGTLTLPGSGCCNDLFFFRVDRKGVLSATRKISVSTPRVKWFNPLLGQGIIPLLPLVFGELVLSRGRGHSSCSLT